jgi:hypothetical protein
MLVEQNISLEFGEVLRGVSNFSLIIICEEKYEVYKQNVI